MSIVLSLVSDPACKLELSEPFVFEASAPIARKRCSVCLSLRG